MIPGVYQHFARGAHGACNTLHAVETRVWQVSTPYALTTLYCVAPRSSDCVLRTAVRRNVVTQWRLRGRVGGKQL